jgi:predicted nucleic acid-binding protein
LLTLEFPPTEEVKRKAADLVTVEIGRRLVAPSVVLTEFVKIAGPRMGEEAARTRLRSLRERGMRTAALDEEEAFVAGSLLLSHRNVPMADALIGSFVEIGTAEYVVTDDSHFKTLGIKTKWF